MRMIVVLTFLVACHPEPEVVTRTITETVTNTVTIEVPVVDTAGEPEDTEEPVEESTTTISIRYETGGPDSQVFPGDDFVYLGGWSIAVDQPDVELEAEVAFPLSACPDASFGGGVYNPASQWAAPLPLSDFLATCELVDNWHPLDVVFGPATALDVNGEFVYSAIPLASVPANEDPPVFGMFCVFTDQAPPPGLLLGFAAGLITPRITAVDAAGNPVTVISLGDNGAVTNPDYAVILSD